MASTPIPKLPFANLPTPVEPLPRLSEALRGPTLWIKRDDLTGLAFGGNKTRKLEYLLAEARSHQAKTLITVGAVQSNHCRQTAASAARFGLDCILVLEGEQPEESRGNVLLDRLLGAEFVWAGDRDSGEALQETFDWAWEGGRRPFLIPYGGSTATGAVAYVEAMDELLGQGVPVERILLASSSGGTQAGLIAGARLHAFKGSILGISVQGAGAELQAPIAALASETLSLLDAQAGVRPDEVEVDDRFVGEGYAVLGDREREAIRMFAELEGVLLDPVYTGRAAGGMIELIRSGAFKRGENVLFWHTGGTPALFAYGDELTASG